MMTYRRCGFILCWPQIDVQQNVNVVQRGSAESLHTHLLPEHEIREAIVKPSTSTRQCSEEPL